jgi:hypothetical protein
VGLMRVRSVGKATSDEKNITILAEMLSKLSFYGFSMGLPPYPLPQLYNMWVRHEGYSGSDRCQGTNGSGPMGRLSRPIRVRFRDKIKSLLRGQVILSI